LTNIINWTNVCQKSEEFQTKEPAKWTFIENFFEKEFYEKLYDTYPKYDNSWKLIDSFDKISYRKFWGKENDEQIVEQENDPAYSKEWNEFVKYLHSDEFLEKIREFSGVTVTKLKHFQFALIKKNGFQLPHIHNVGPSTLIFMIYFSKNWSKGDPGGTYITTDEDESNLVFEPYNLDNSAMIFQDGPNAGHGVRKVEKNVERRAIQIYLEEYTLETGWSGDKKEEELVEL
tara:strand:- start:56 stop:748 length:693 start_codon:yes stop_codon:yes gene_type:complete